MQKFESKRSSFCTHKLNAFLSITAIVLLCTTSFAPQRRSTLLPMLVKPSCTARPLSIHTLSDMVRCLLFFSGVTGLTSASEKTNCKGWRGLQGSRQASLQESIQPALCSLIQLAHYKTNIESDDGQTSPGSSIHTWPYIGEPHLLSLYYPCNMFICWQVLYG